MIALVWNAVAVGFLAALILTEDTPWWLRIIWILLALMNAAAARDVARRMKRATARSVELEVIAGPALDRIKTGADVTAVWVHDPDRLPGTVRCNFYEVCDGD